jgi:hypothetical protein
MLDPSTIRRAAGLLALCSLACSSLTAQARRESRLREQLDEHRFQQPLSAVWPAALRLMHDRHLHLAGRDRTVVGAPSDGWLSKLTKGGFETRSNGKGGVVLETREDTSALRYRAEGIDAGAGTCRVIFTAVRRTGRTPSEEKSRDLDMELELVRRLEPEAAARILAASEGAAR